MVECHLSGQSGEVSFLSLKLEVMDPLVSVSDLEKDGESESLLHSFVDFGLSILGNEGFFRNEGVNELQLCQLVVSIHSVLGWSLDLDSLQLLLQRLVLLLRQVVVEEGISLLFTSSQGEEHFG